jgi:hypothetical protein
MKKTEIIVGLFCFSLIITVSSMVRGQSGNNIDDGNSNYSIPVYEDSEYTYKSVRDGSQSYTTSGFEVTVENNTYKISRVDDVSNPGTSLKVESARVVGNTLVIKEEFIDTTDDNVVTPSVVSTSLYTESWELDLDIDTVAIEHPYGENPYIRELE